MKRVLITPLDWGLGHATRCIPVIRELINRGCAVFIGGCGYSLELLKNEFPSLSYFNLPGYDPVYPSNGRMVLKMGLQVPKFISVIKQEHAIVQSLVHENRIDFIISDNRYGCWSATVPSVFMTHQINIKLPDGFRWLSKKLGQINARMIDKFSTCWIPDYPDAESNLSGELSDVTRTGITRVRYIGPLSRFEHCRTIEEYDVACILSGPEPQRSIFEKKVIPQLEASGLRYVVVRGLLVKEGQLSPNVTNFLNSRSLQDVISKSTLIISRSGYSTIMDLLALRKKAIVVPTPGQTEQEYLAYRWSQRGVLQAMTQDNFDLQIAMKASVNYTGFNDTVKNSNELLKNELDRMLISEKTPSSVK